MTALLSSVTVWRMQTRTTISKPLGGQLPVINCCRHRLDTCRALHAGLRDADLGVAQPERWLFRSDSYFGGRQYRFRIFRWDGIRLGRGQWNERSVGRSSVAGFNDSRMDIIFQRRVEDVCRWADLQRQRYRLHERDFLRTSHVCGFRLAHTHAGAHTYPEAAAVPESKPNSLGYGNAHSYADTCADTKAKSDSQAQSVPVGFANTYANAGADTDSQTDSISKAEPDPDARLSFGEGQGAAGIAPE
jgi:hypothetical protein